MGSPAAATASAWKIAMVVSFAVFLLAPSAIGAEQSVHVRGRRIPPPRPPTPSTPSRESCYSTLSNDTLPAAHIRGVGDWMGEGVQYSQQWDCCDSRMGSAFVRGGMWFRQADNSLYVPVCGWYYVSSQVTFKGKVGTANQFQSFSHTLKVERNCNSSLVTTSYHHTAFSVVSSSTDMAAAAAKTSTVVSDLIKICRGGRIYVSIPTAASDCCPTTSDSVTMITAYLVQESDCSWSPTCHSSPVEEFQEI